MTPTMRLWSFCILVGVGIILMSAHGFHTASSSSSVTRSYASLQQQRHSSCAGLPHRPSRRLAPLANSFFNDMLNFFEDLMDDGSKKKRYGEFNQAFPPKQWDGTAPYPNGDDEDDENDATAGSFRVVTIPVQSVKPGGLRLFLMLYLMGMQNTPDKGSWRASQPTTDEYVVDFFFHDRTALLTVNIGTEEIAITRVGSAPSTAYMMQESMIVSGLLDELQQCAFDETVVDTNRLLVLPEPKDAIEKAREALAFG